MQEGLTGRQFHDLYKIETALKQVPGVEEAGPPMCVMLRQQAGTDSRSEGHYGAEC